jgi:hypothetical protein
VLRLRGRLQRALGRRPGSDLNPLDNPVTALGYPAFLDELKSPASAWAKT